MKKLTKELQGKDISELEKEVQSLRKEIAKLKIERKVKPPKDTNLIRKKEKRLASILTMITQKELGVIEKNK